MSDEGANSHIAQSQIGASERLYSGKRAG